jgi:hypothetical protein
MMAMQGPRRLGFATLAGAWLLSLGAACSEDKVLKVTALDPAEGDAEGGQYVTVKGNRFQKDGARSVRVYFGGVRGTTIGIDSDSELTVQAPSGKAGSVVDVEFHFEPGGYLKMEKGFRYTETTTGPTLDGIGKKP